jgi:hypothetical protein
MELSRRSAALFLAFAVACGGEPEGPSDALRADVRDLRRAIERDPATAPIQEVEAMVDERPARAARLLESGAIPAARRQAQSMRDAAVRTPEGRAWADRLSDAYDERVRGLDEWRRYLNEGSENDELLLDSMTHIRAGHFAVLEVDMEMDQLAPLSGSGGPATNQPAP